MKRNEKGNRILFIAWLKITKKKIKKLKTEDKIKKIKNILKLMYSPTIILCGSNVK